MTLELYHPQTITSIGCPSKEKIVEFFETKFVGKMLAPWAQAFRWFEDGPYLQGREDNPDGTSSWFVIGWIKEELPRPHY